MFHHGGLRQGWPAVMAIADACCAHATRPPGLADLLRTLASFAWEVPSQELPENMLKLAAESGNAKMQVEARILGARLARRCVDDYLRQIRSTPTPAASTMARPPRRGLWETTVALNPLPRDRRLNPVAGSLAELRAELEREFPGHLQDQTGLYPRRKTQMVYRNSSDLTTPDRLLAGVVQAIHHQGPPAVREALAGVSRVIRHRSPTGLDEVREYSPVGIVLAIDLWVSGQLRPERLDDVAKRSIPREAFTAPLRREQKLGWEEIARRIGEMPGLTNDIEVAPNRPLVLPGYLGDPTDALGFLRAAESLLLAEANPVVLCAPTWADCTLDFDDLILRFGDASGRPTSSLDLVQALWRLRPCEPSRASELDGITLPLHFGYVRPDGTEVSDGIDLVRTWLQGGGLPKLIASDQDGQWTTATHAPVSWVGVRHLPAALEPDPWLWGDPVGAARARPLWPDRLIPDRSDSYHNWDLPALASGDLGLPIHDHLWSWGCSLEATTDLARRKRLVPELMAQAAVERHRIGELGLGTFVTRLRELFETDGCFAGLWPCAMAMASALTLEARKPSELPQLLRLLIEYAAEVPEPGIPDQLLQFAHGKGSTKSHAEARALVETLQ